MQDSKVTLKCTSVIPFGDGDELARLMPVIDKKTSGGIYLAEGFDVIIKERSEIKLKEGDVYIINLDSIRKS